MLLAALFPVVEDSSFQWAVLQAINQSSELTGSVGAGGYVELSLRRLGLCFDRSISTGCRSSLPATQERERSQGSELEGLDERSGEHLMCHG